jgi:predicted ArsR family transcriptional regulator
VQISQSLTSAGSALPAEVLPAPTLPAPVLSAEAREPLRQTRDRVARLVLDRGPITAAAIAHELQLTAAAVRRHLDALYDAGLVSLRDARPTAKRGRPAKAYVLTDAGHCELTSAYDDLATSAMTYLAEQLGPEAIRTFAQRRVAELETRYAPIMAAAGADVSARTQALAGALTADGYAASTRAIPADPGSSLGEQLCQGHCPVQHVAERFPQLCEAETDAISRLLGVHVQRLATLAGGAHVCTTHIPHSSATIHSTSPARPEGRLPS